MKYGFFLILFIHQQIFAETLLLQPKEPQEKHQDVNIDFSKYVDFAVRWTSYEYHGEALPQVKIQKTGLVQVFAYGEETISAAAKNNQKLPLVLAIYDRDYKTIYISDSVDLKDPLLEVTFVHEAVHYLQDINGYTDSLDGHIVCTESEAYDVQVLWQIEFNVAKEEIPFARERSLLSAMNCMGNQFAAIKHRE